MAKKTEDGNATLALANAKCTALMNALNQIVNRHFKGEIRLDEETFRIWNAAKAIHWAETYQALQQAIENVRKNQPA